MILIIAQTLELPRAESLEYHTAPKPACSKTWNLWIPFPTTQNHVLGVSSELGLLRSNGLGVMLHYYLDHGSNFGIAGLRNLWNNTMFSTQTGLLKDTWSL
jgi:hypothetical protein